MGWTGAMFGAWIGSHFGGPIGALIGAVIGGTVDFKKVLGSNADDEAAKHELLTLTAISAMLAKMAKADGVVSSDEVRYCERVFDNIGLKGEKRAYCIRIFRQAKNDSHTIYEYADNFADLQRDYSVREIIYGCLWDLACVDDYIHPNEEAILRNIVSHLRLNPNEYNSQAHFHGVRQSGDGRSGGNAGQSARSELDPYEVLGVSRDATNDDIRKAYRELAKKLHPDVLRANGLSEEMLGKANERMARVNAAWDEIKRERGIR